MKYILLIYGNQATWQNWTEEEYQALMRAHDAFTEELTQSGEFVDTQALADPMLTKTIRARNGVPEVTDGPFAEIKEQLAGYYVIECDSDDRALEIAKRVPDTRFSPVEVRPLMDEVGMEM